MRIFMSLVLVVFLASQALALDITITIPDTKLTRVKDAMLKAYPNNVAMKADPSGVIDPATGEVKQVPIFTDALWLKEIVRRFIVNTIKTAETRELIQQAEDAVVLPADHNALVTSK